MWSMLIGSAVTGCATTADSSTPPRASTSEPRSAVSARHAGRATEPDAGSAKQSARAAHQNQPDIPRHPVAIYGAPGPPVIYPISGFRAGSAKLEPRHFEEANEVAKFLREEPDWRVVVEGHADAKEGIRALELSERRAAVVRDYLVTKGIARERMVVKGLADRRPLGGSNDEVQRSRNRRVTFRRIEGDGGAD
jgi:outer membrane protein OmpA-like peptidoglycan-associated protein